MAQPEYRVVGIRPDNSLKGYAQIVTYFWDFEGEQWVREDDMHASNVAHCTSSDFTFANAGKADAFASKDARVMHAIHVMAITKDLG